VSSNDVLGGPAAGNEGLRLASTDRLHGIHVCHCLVFDTSLFEGEDSRKHSGVLAANSDEVLPLVLAWQPRLKEANAGVACAMVRSARVQIVKKLVFTCSSARTLTWQQPSRSLPCWFSVELLRLVGARRSVVLLVMIDPKSWSWRAHPTTAWYTLLPMFLLPSAAF
jgi:hypothetical protein